MPRLPGLVATLAALFLVVACDPADKGTQTSRPSEVQPNAVAGGEIEVTPLDEVASTEVQSRPAPADRMRGSEIAVPQADPAISEREVAVPAPVPAEDVAEVKPKSAGQLACEKKKGKWISVANTSLRTCVKVTRDSGKQCIRASQCESTCLARSGTCAPFKPLLGCNEILQNDGSRVTLCVE